MIAKSQLWPPPRLQRYLEVTYCDCGHYTTDFVLYCVVISFVVFVDVCTAQLVVRSGPVSVHQSYQMLSVLLSCTASLPHCTHAAQYTQLVVASKQSLFIHALYPRARIYCSSSATDMFNCLNS
jgi:hypothetical protein